jgi:putative spermidine/putrescine transport system ATP-binding protein
VALARAIAVEPRVLLLDEPFAALDRALRLDLQLEFRRLQRRLALTTVLVTHDQDEAMSMADRVAVMRAGRLEQVDEAARVYDEPASLFVAGFVGESVILPGQVTRQGAAECQVNLNAGATLVESCKDTPPVGARIVLAVRPEQLVLHDAPAMDRIPARLRLSAPIGASLVHDVAAADVEMKVTGQRHGPFNTLRRQTGGGDVVLSQISWADMRYPRKELGLSRQRIELPRWAHFACLQ